MGWLTESAMYSAGGAAKSRRRRAIVGNVRYEAAGTAAMLVRTNFFVCGKLADVAALVAASQM